MAGQLLDQFVDAFLGTSQVVLSGANFILNEKQRNNTLLRMVMRGNDMEDMLKGGDTITDQLILDEDRTYGAYNPLEERSPRISNHLTEYTINWAFTDAHVSFSKHEKGINQMSQLNRGARSYVFKNIIRAKWSNLFMDINNGMEREFFAQPSAGTMETVTTGTRVPYSIFCSIHEFGATLSNALPKATVPPGFTTIQGINPSTFTEWQNPVESYSDPDFTVAHLVWDGFSAMSRMYNRLRFEPLGIKPEYGQSDMVDGFIMCSLNGLTMWEDAQRAMNDQTRHGPSNAGYPGLNYNGIPVKWVESMDHANVWDDGASGFAGENDATVDEDGNATANPNIEGPRYVWIIPKYFRKYVHSDHFLEEETPPASVNQPRVRTVFFDCWHNNGTRSRKRAGGVVTPNENVTGAYV